MSKLLKNIQLAVELGGDDLKDFAKVAGMTSKDFKKAFEEVWPLLQYLLLL